MFCYAWEAFEEDQNYGEGAVGYLFFIVTTHLYRTITQFFLITIHFITVLHIYAALERNFADFPTFAWYFERLISPPK